MGHIRNVPSFLYPHTAVCGASELDVSIGDYLFDDCDELVFPNVTCTQLGVLPIVVTYTNALAGTVEWLSNFTVVYCSIV